MHRIPLLLREYSHRMQYVVAFTIHPTSCAFGHVSRWFVLLTRKSEVARCSRKKKPGDGRAQEAGLRSS
jgi:hypothetical protein